MPALKKLICAKTDQNQKCKIVTVDDDDNQHKQKDLQS
jgi:hypothetical protein